ncbi:MAG TPA: hypothetical protein DC049_03990, partial [Spirochaetia bacterium]|nr:hypothetical protein [Spirochaetia bacterium]
MKKLYAIMLLLPLLSAESARFQMYGVYKDLSMHDPSCSGYAKWQYADWLNEKKAQILIVYADADESRWSSVSVSFTPDRDASFILTLMGIDSGTDEEPRYCLFDAISAEGAVIKNGDFEQTVDKVTPLDWSAQSKKNTMPPVLITDKQYVKSGAASVMTWKNGSFIQYITVQKDVPLQISLQVKAISGVEAERLLKEALSIKPAYIHKWPFNNLCTDLPAPARNNELAQSGYLSVALYGADAHGITDSTKAIQQAITDAYEYELVCFFPAGTYLISDTLKCMQKVYAMNNGVLQPGKRKANALVGSAKTARPIIKLEKNAAGFNDPQKPKAMV